jgi:hypothetical protein
VACQHEGGIQLLERAVTTVTAVCITTPRLAARWAEAVELRWKWQVAG